eukprot:TRINITY_DN4849_c0_g2_i1.p1 TRINITY_DN4849_c0_g2~~TRINITY_DN4849_c0_g2_i1.p1  ORF type:complete len:636 (-),score=86.67 TRINITY_DN4849_c0_g2_i1:52-1959(-)
MEYCPGGELFEYIVRESRLEEKEACRIFQQILWAIEHIHSLGVVHRDIKPENMILDTKKNIKMIDFGLSNRYAQGDMLKTACGSPCYAAPEMIAGRKYVGLEVDIWSCGVVLFALICGYLPFEDPNTNKLYKKILNCEYTIPEFVSPAARDLIKRILNVDPKKRYRLEDIRSHPWYNLYSPKKVPIGINPKSHKLPVDEEILLNLREYGFEIDFARKCVESNKHNSVTSTYFLLLKKYRMLGHHSSADIHSEKFDPALLRDRNQSAPLPQKPSSKGLEESTQAKKKSSTRVIVHQTMDVIDRESVISPKKIEYHSRQIAEAGKPCTSRKGSIATEQLNYATVEKSIPHDSETIPQDANYSTERQQPNQARPPRRRPRQLDSLAPVVETDKRRQLPSITTRRDINKSEMKEKIADTSMPAKEESNIPRRRGENLNRSLDYGQMKEQMVSVVPHTNNFVRESFRQSRGGVLQKQNPVVDHNMVDLESILNSNNVSALSTPQNQVIPRRNPRKLDATFLEKGATDTKTKPPTQSISPTGRKASVGYDVQMPNETKNTFRAKLAEVMNRFSPSNRKAVTIRTQRRIGATYVVQRPKQNANMSYEAGLNDSHQLNTSNLQEIESSLQFKVTQKAFSNSKA